MPTSVNVTNLKINELTEAQYDSAVQGGVIGANELSILTDVDAGQVIQVATLPTASVDELGNIYQFIGTTDANYTNGYFYKCVSDGQDPATYSWTQVDVQPQSGGLPSQTGNAGKFLTTDGTDASWSDTLGITLKSSATTPITVVRDTYNHSITFSGSYATPTIDLFLGTVWNRPTVNLPKVSATEVSSAVFKKQYNDGGFSLPRGSGYISVQVDTMPTAGSVFLGNIVQYIGATDSTYTHGHLYECVSDGQTPATYSWAEVQLGGGGSSYTAGTGIDITGGVISVTSPTLQNTATTVNSLGVIGSVISSGTNNTAVGVASSAGIGNVSYMGMTVIGAGASSNHNRAIAIGNDAHCNGQGSIAIGRCTVSSNNTIGLNATEGAGLATLNDANSMYVAIKNGVWTKLLSSDETIPTARLTKVNSTITLTAAGWSSNTQTVSVTGVTADGVVLVSPDPTDQSAYTSAGILCTAQAAGSLEFTCTNTPTNDIDVVVVML